MAEAILTTCSQGLSASPSGALKGCSLSLSTWQAWRTAKLHISLPTLPPVTKPFGLTSVLLVFTETVLRGTPSSLAHTWAT